MMPVDNLPRSTMIAASLQDLATELILQILHLCNDVRSILRFAGTSWRYFRMVKGSVGLQLRIELDLNGMDLVGESSDYWDLQEKLRRYQDAWINPKPSRIAHQFIRGLRHVQNIQLCGGMICFQPWLKDLGATFLQNNLEQVTYGVQYREYALDQGQDLAVLTSLRSEEAHLQVQFLSIASGLPHPLAQHPSIRVTSNLHSEFLYLPFYSSSYQCAFMRNLIAIKFPDYRNTPDILIWDWKSGALLHRVAQANSDHCEFIFLDESHLAVYSNKNLEGRSNHSFFEYQCSLLLSIYSISTPSSDSDYTGPDVHIESVPIHTPTLQFEFPEFLDRRFVIRRPGVRHLRSNAIGQPLLSDFAYNRAVTLDLWVPYSFRNVQKNLHIFISGDKLREHLSQGRTGTMKWDEWGENATRWFRDSPFEASASHVSRYIEIKEGTGQHGQLSVFAFDTAAIRRYLTRFSKSNGYRPRVADRLRVVGKDDPTVIEGVFTRHVVSRLPYMVLTKGWNYPVSYKWAVDGDCIVGIDRTWGGRGTTVSVYKLQI